MSAPRIVVTIDEVRLHGFDPRERSAIGDALTRELARRFAREPVPPVAREASRVDAGTLALGRSAGAAAIGAAIATRVHREVRTPC